jgi:hypothetical protein
MVQEGAQGAPVYLDGKVLPAELEEGARLCGRARRMQAQHG